MSQHDGVYILESASNQCAALKAMGFSEADIKLVTSPQNVMKVTTITNADKSCTSSYESSCAKHLDVTFTAKLGETKTLEKPFPCSITTTQKSENEFCQKLEMGNGKVIDSTFCMNNYGMTVHATIDGVFCREEYKKVSPKINGFYTLDTEDNMENLIKQAMQNITPEDWNKVKKEGLSFRIKESGDSITVDECIGSAPKKTIVYKVDESVDYSNAEWGIEETRLLTKVSPGSYKVVTKNKKTGKITNLDMSFTDCGMSEVICSGDVKATAFYRRCPDIEGSWKPVSVSDGNAYMDALGIPEPMKSKMLAERAIEHLERLPCGKVKSKSESAFFGDETIIKLGEQWSIEIPGLGTVTGICTEHGNKFLTTHKFNGKTISSVDTYSEDFKVQESEVDGCRASKIKMIYARQ